MLDYCASSGRFLKVLRHDSGSRSIRVRNGDASLATARGGNVRHTQCHLGLISKRVGLERTEAFAVLLRLRTWGIGVGVLLVELSRLPPIELHFELADPFLRLTVARESIRACRTIIIDRTVTHETAAHGLHGCSNDTGIG